MEQIYGNFQIPEIQGEVSMCKQCALGFFSPLAHKRLGNEAKNKCTKSL